MVKMTYHNDGKCKSQSYCFHLSTSNDLPPSLEVDAQSWYTIDVYGYGETKQEALDSLDPAMEWLFKEWKAIENLYTSGVYHQNIVEVDGLDNPIHTTEE